MRANNTFQIAEPAR